MSWLIFKSKASADVQMLPSHAEVALGYLDRNAAEPGILQPQDLPGALARLRVAIEQDEARRAAAAKTGCSDGREVGRQDGQDKDSDDADADGSAGDSVPLKRRLWPLMAMMERCAAAGEPIVWQP